MNPQLGEGKLFTIIFWIIMLIIAWLLSSCVAVNDQTMVHVNMCYSGLDLHLGALNSSLSNPKP